jgi:PAS domain S-box-containing protein
MQQSISIQTFADYLTVTEAAEFLGVSPWTLRNWDKAGKLKPIRHPVNGYRIYRQQDLETVLAADTMLGKRRATLTPCFDWNELGKAEHFVQFYETDAYLVQSVSGFIGSALAAKEGAIVVATKSHRDRIHKKLKARGLDLDALSASGQYSALDAADTLAEFMADGMPDADRFVKVIGGIIDKAAQDRGRVRAFGEMVALLWAQGNRAAARRLEDLWNSLATTRSFALFCAYPLNGFGEDNDGGPFHDICACHSRVIPAESFASLGTKAEQLRAITILQQKAQELEAATEDREQADRDRARLAAIIESSEDAIISKTLDGTIQSWNASAERMFGYTPQEAVGKPITLIIPPDRLSEEVDILARLRRGERIEHYETIRVSKEGRQINISLAISPIRDRAGNIVGASKIARDITDRKLAEAARRDGERRKDEFLATLAHELRNPLAPIRNSLHILRMNDGFSPAVQRVHEMMERQVHQLVRMVDDLLEVARISRGNIDLKKERVELATIIHNALETSKPLIEAGGHKLTVSLPAEPILLDGDPVRLAQVFANVLNNSAKYTDKGGQITVSARRDGSNVAVSIRDTGIGIPREMLSRVFDMFAQVDHTQRRSQGGLGIGLSLVHRLVAMHGGSVEARSDGVGHGSEFIIRLPAAAYDSYGTDHEHAGSGPKSAVLARRRILVVDDNQDAGDSLGMLLKFLGADVHVVYDGQSALEKLRLCRPSVVLLDLGMPGLDGFEVARQVRQDPELRDLMLIALTGWGQEEDRRHSLEAGFDHHLVKPVDLGALQALLASLETCPGRRGEPIR